MSSDVWPKAIFTVASGNALGAKSESEGLAEGHIQNDHANSALERNDTLGGVEVGFQPKNDD